MSFEELLPRAQQLYTQTRDTLDALVETAELHYTVWDNKDMNWTDTLEFTVPFSNTVHALALTLRDIIILLSAKKVDGNRLTRLFQHTYILSTPNPRFNSKDRRIPPDPLQTYNVEARDVLMSYADQQGIYGGTVARDHFLMHTLDKLMDSGTFSKEGADVVSNDMRAVLEHSLDSLQRLYNTDVESMMNAYVSLLEDIGKEIVAQDSTFETLQRSNRRHLFALSPQAQGRFRVAKSEPEGELKYGVDYIGPRVRRGERHAYSVRARILGQEGSESLLEKLASGETRWSTHLDEVVNFIKTAQQEEIDKYPLLEYNDGQLIPIRYVPVAPEDIVGQEENVTRLLRVLYAFGEAGNIPEKFSGIAAVALIGGPGLGKTMSMRAATDTHENLRIILVNSSASYKLSNLTELARNVPYQVIAYVDDLDPEHLNSGYFKTTMSGMRNDWPRNLMLAFSMNMPEFQKLKSAVKDRLQIILNYDKHPNDLDHWNKVFHVVARHEGVEYSDGLWQDFLATKTKRNWWRNKIEGINGRQIESYLREQKSVQGIEFPEYLQMPKK